MNIEREKFLIELLELCYHERKEVNGAGHRQCDKCKKFSHQYIEPNGVMFQDIYLGSPHGFFKLLKFIKLHKSFKDFKEYLKFDSYTTYKGSQITRLNIHPLRIDYLNIEIIDPEKFCR